MLSRRLLLAVAAIALAAPAIAQEKSIVVSSTTSTQDSGLFGYMLPIFKQKTGIDVKVVAQGTGRRSTPRGAAMPTWCSCTPSRRKRNSCRKASA